MSQKRTPDDDDSDDDDGGVGDDHDDGGDGCGGAWRPRCEYVHTTTSQAMALVRYIRQALAARQTKRTRAMFHADRQAGVACICTYVLLCFWVRRGRCFVARGRVERAAMRVIGLPYESLGGGAGVEASRFWTRPSWPSDRRTNKNAATYVAVPPRGCFFLCIYLRICACRLKKSRVCVEVSTSFPKVLYWSFFWEKSFRMAGKFLVNRCRCPGSIVPPPPVLAVDVYRKLWCVQPGQFVLLFNVRLIGGGGRGVLMRAPSGSVAGSNTICG